MTVQICSCEGLNPNCNKCFGSGYVNVAESAADQAQKKAVQKNKPKYQSSVPENIEVLSRAEVENIVGKIIEKLDLKSKKQMQLLNSIPFSSTTFRRDFKDKFESLRTLENAKQFLRTELQAIKDATSKKFPGQFAYGHYLSDKEIDVTSNRQLKTLIREYKKLKDRADTN